MLGGSRAAAERLRRRESLAERLPAQHTACCEWRWPLTDILRKAGHSGRGQGNSVWRWESLTERLRRRESLAEILQRGESLAERLPAPLTAAQQQALPNTANTQ